MDPQLQHRAERIRQFNRFYTKQIGVLNEGLLDSPFSLTEVRVLYELAHRTSPTASELAAGLNLDAGYLSRILGAFEKKKLIRRSPSNSDARQLHIDLTARGQQTFLPLEERSTTQVAGMLEKIPPPAQERLLSAIQTIERLLAPPARSTAYLLRSHQPGDIGWVIQRHGVVYAREYNWTIEFEALVAEIAAAFLRDFDPARERCWIAERDGVNLGCIFLVNGGDGIAKLRLLLVEEQARGLGIGRRLVQECVAFARQAGYRKITLWTQSILHAARRLYADAGFRLVEEQAHHSFGANLMGETWELDLVLSV
jgi:DNA-binding MarR family transcriptional regulator/N-acetylglutamate synthase-like GNAT family acetyltransferase